MIEAVVKELRVAAGPGEAFHRFTAGIDSWWPKASHSVSQERCKVVRFGSGVGESIVEEDQDGVEHPWGVIRAWEPDSRVVFSWHPGRGPETAQEVEVTFQADGSGTMIRLEHRGWEALGEAGAAKRDEYEGGWNPVLGLYAGSWANAAG